MSKWFLPRQIAKAIGVDIGKVLGWLKSGELVGVNVATTASSGGQPRWRVSEFEFQKFCERRQNRPPTKPPRKRRTSDDIVQFIIP